MKTTVQALKELYATLGGDLADVALIDRVPDMIEALNSIAVAVPAPTAEDKGKVMTVGEDGALGYAGALPPVTAEDAGKVMTVDEQGVWNPAEASGGGNYVLKKLGTYNYNIAPHDAGWNAQSVAYITNAPDDFAFYGHASFSGITLDMPTYGPLSFVLSRIEIIGNSIGITGIVYQYFADALESGRKGNIDFYYYAKA